MVDPRGSQRGMTDASHELAASHREALVVPLRGDGHEECSLVGKHHEFDPTQEAGKNSSSGYDSYSIHSSTLQDRPHSENMPPVSASVKEYDTTFFSGFFFQTSPCTLR
eukprot:TRINITY_DN19360_c0_g1::TRINITY_DN19360_c0_g1_i1::g.7895::m.7895 TRINITY_DN19360_c0_g1::TRINITY_DN19360_c0_g1_i1::g.7895  ORF type:complete len:109 (+),score=-9.13,Med12-PQL/PF12144.3/0.045 TRINITY_DN19360_c0_g1_i1:202-528(+)